MKIAVYSRKSKQTETGDSIKNQINICKDYARSHFSDCEFIVYEDEGFSGGNAERPMFKRLLNDAGKRLFDVLVCYRLDRLSRNILDFSTTLELMEANGIGFVSVTERFDTTTPMGKAMMYIASVFAQLERDTTAQRIVDNFSELAKTGRYLIGKPPEGFRKKRISNICGKQYNILEAVPEEADKIRLIYNLYLKWHSLTKIETYCLQNNIRSKNGNTIGTDWISRALRHQLYATADRAAHDYFKDMGALIYSPAEAFNGLHGIMVYRRVQKGKSTPAYQSPPERLVISVGEHEGIIPSADWIAVQRIINERKSIGISLRKPTGNYGVFNGLLRCAHCGSPLKPTSIRKNGVFYYKCILKEKSRMGLCAVKNLSHKADVLIINYVQGLLLDKNDVAAQFAGIPFASFEKINSTQKDISAVKKLIHSNEKLVGNLILRLANLTNEIALKRVEEHIAKLESEIAESKNLLRVLEADKIKRAGSQPDADITSLSAFILSGGFASIPDTLEKRNILRKIIKDIIWDGEKAVVNFIKL
ncbi:MAG: recombinase family protein [Defluviitaleaceae bacterium]|nr:recombinase family protein [Defluviitaleaceae bacterium]MCL2835333.1 recombinase family protein [Defluviitaleaceae bacterium]